MKRRHLPELAPETRAEIARRRLEQLALSFSGGETPPPVIDDYEDDDDPDEGAVTRPPRHVSTPRRAPRPALSPTHLRIAAAGAVALGIVLTWWLLAERPRSADVGTPVTLSGSAAASSGPSPSASSSAAPTEVVVDVAGEVRRPGIVTLPAGSRVHEAIAKAGGLKRGVDTTSLNLARVLVDGEQVLVGVEIPAGASAGAAVGPATPGATVNLNTATLEHLDALPGVGPVTAQHILDWRTEHGSFASVDDLLDVPGIGDKTLADLRDLVTV